MPYFFLALIMLYLFSSNVWHIFPQGQGYDTNSELSPGWNRPFRRPPCSTRFCRR